MSPNYNKPYWRVDAEYQTIAYVSDVSDKAPVGVWIQTLGQPYAYFDSEEAARIAFKGMLESESDRINQLLIASRKEYASGEHCSSEELKARLAAKFLMNEGKQIKDLTHEEVFGHVGPELNLKDAAEYLEILESELYDMYVSELINAELMFKVEDLKVLKKGWKNNE